jgi:DNA-binding beta-propeller fold protein YncE
VTVLRRLAVAALAAAAAAAPAAASASGPQGLHKGAPGARDVVVVANAEGGTVSIVDTRTLRVVREINVVPDGRNASFADDDPAHALFGQRLVEEAGGENYAQDVDVSPDGRVLYVSRGHRGDMAAFDIATGELRWKLRIPGFRSDHMTISEDGRRLYVSALTENEVVAVDTGRHAITGRFATGQWPHDNHLTEDGERLYNGSIGNIITPTEARGASPPPPYQLTIVDATTLERLRSHTFDRGIRPFVITSDESRVYAQLSEYHGVIEFGLREGRVLRSRELPIDDGVTEDDYDFEAPHHGLAISHDEKTLCLAARASDYVALVSTRTLAATALIEVADAPGWAAIGPGGRRCFVANTRADNVSAISLAKRKEVARIRTGDGPKLIEAARLPQSVLCNRRDVPGCAPKLRLRRRCGRGGGLRVRLVGETDAVRRVAFKIGGRVIGRDRAAPFGRTLRPRALSRWSGRRLSVIAEVTRGPTARLKRSVALPRCS